MESGSQGHSPLPQVSPLLNEVCNILGAWDANKSIWEAQDWPQMGIYNPDIIRAFQVHVRKYKLAQKKQFDRDMAVIGQFLKRGQEICDAHTAFHVEVLSDDHQVRKDGLSSTSEQELGASFDVSRSVPSQSSRMEMLEHGGENTDYKDELATVPAAATGYVSFAQVDRATTGLRHLQDNDVLQRETDLCDHQQTLSSVSAVQHSISDQSRLAIAPPLGPCCFFCESTDYGHRCIWSRPGVHLRVPRGIKPGRFPSNYTGCYKCGGLNHFLRDCPDQQAQALSLMNPSRSCHSLPQRVSSQCAKGDAARVLPEGPVRAVEVLSSPGATSTTPPIL